MPILYTGKYLGLFAVARWLTAGGVRILCYHGCSLADEHADWPGTFMKAETFERRMAFLADHGYAVIDLDEAIERLDAGSLPPNATVLTFDDGWLGTFTKMTPVLASHGFPGTVYVASYYMERQAPVFNMIVPYMLARAAVDRLDLQDVDDALAGSFDLRDADGRAAASRAIQYHGRNNLDGAGRQAALRRLADAVGYDLDAALAQRLFFYADAGEMKASRAKGIDIQLHTHRHQSAAMNGRDIGAEIEDNRRALGAATDGRLIHFCYPSGDYEPSTLPRLAELGIETATTIVSGFNYPDTPRLELRRFLDAETITDIEFEAEMSGFFELMRKAGFQV